MKPKPIEDLEGSAAKRFIEIDKRTVTEREIEDTKRGLETYYRMKPRK